MIVRGNKVYLVITHQVTHFKRIRLIPSKTHIHHATKIIFMVKKQNIRRSL